MTYNMRKVLVIKNILSGNFKLQHVIKNCYKNQSNSRSCNFSSVDSYTPNVDYYDYCDKPKVYTQLQCFKCCETFEGFSELSNHLAVDHSKKIKKSINCEICDEDFKSNNYLHKHMVRAHKLKPLFRPWV